MRFVQQSPVIEVTNVDDRLRSIMGDNAEKQHKHLNCSKTNVLISLLESPHGVRFENVYVYSKLLQQPKYQYVEKLLTLIDKIGYFTFPNNSDVIPSSKARPNSIFVFDDVACDKQDVIREYFSMVDTRTLTVSISVIRQNT